MAQPQPGAPNGSVLMESPAGWQEKGTYKLLLINFLKIHDKYFNVYLLNLLCYLNETILNKNTYVIKT